LSIEQDDGFIIERFDASPDLAGLGGVLFAEDFDLVNHAAADAGTNAAAEAAPPAPTEADMHAANLRGYQDGFRAALEDVTNRTGLAAEVALRALAEHVQAAQAAAAQAAQGSASAMAERILLAVGELLPELCAEHGPAEAAALAAALLPMLARQPILTVRANPRTLAALQRVIAAQQGDARISQTANDAMEDGDLAIAWQDGLACRDTAALRGQAAAALRTIGIGPRGAAARAPITAAGILQQTAQSMELADVH
jgi:hypothetical protein